VVAGTAAAVGAAYGSAATTPVAVLPCSATAVAVASATYYRCGYTWYSPAYVNGSVAYVVTNAPPGY
jgi:hypothetical protein